ncbi:DUF4180 domain-containing protein [Acinetobacter bereziniae]|uniref:DUF4180 domain-containing protein n=1 Tax=Acinetobacter bereziniae TaxID=106648 RepID=UPI0021D2490D|nr:DUF4180 domain-containing protein [Acinetobacter bereziniae]MCU4418026.1 DUF4180 domain-containing protein [Acinetobacter bereziniae]
MTHMVQHFHNTRILIIPQNQATTYSLHNINDLLSLAFAENIALIALPETSLEKCFFQLENRIAGEFIQKFVNYKIRLAFVGNIEKYTHNIKVLTDFVYESNHGKACWFIENYAELEHKLKQELKN